MQTNETDLKQFFAVYGAVKDCKIIVDRGGISKRFVVLLMYMQYYWYWEPVTSECHGWLLSVCDYCTPHPVLGIGCRPTWNSCVWLLHSRANWWVYTGITMWTLECVIGLLVVGALQVTVVTVTVTVTYIIVVNFCHFNPPQSHLKPLQLVPLGLRIWKLVSKNESLGCLMPTTAWSYGNWFWSVADGHITCCQVTLCHSWVWQKFKSLSCHKVYWVQELTLFRDIRLLCEKSANSACVIWKFCMPFLHILLCAKPRFSYGTNVCDTGVLSGVSWLVGPLKLRVTIQLHLVLDCWKCIVTCSWLVYRCQPVSVLQVGLQSCTLWKKLTTRGILCNFNCCKWKG